MVFVAPLADRALLGLSGVDATEFLQGVITQDLTHADNAHAIYAAHLTPQGKFLYDFFVLKVEDMWALDVHVNELMDIAKTLHGYVISRDVEFHDLRDTYSLYARFGYDEDLAPQGEIHPNAQGVLTYTDPRLSAMGERLVAPLNTPLEGVNATCEDYHAHRINLTIPDGHVDALKKRTLINEMGFEDLRGVSFKKGCYVGQELTARTKHRTEPKKRLVHVSFDGEPAAIGTPLMKGTQEAGWIFSQHAGNGLAIVRTRYAHDDITLNGAPVALQKPMWASYTF